MSSQDKSHTFPSYNLLPLLHFPKKMLPPIFPSKTFQGIMHIVPYRGFSLNVPLWWTPNLSVEELLLSHSKSPGPTGSRATSPCNSLSLCEPGHLGHTGFPVSSSFSSFPLTNSYLRSFSSTGYNIFFLEVSRP